MRRLALIGLALIAGCEQDDEARIVGELASDRIELTAEFNEPIVSIDVDEGETVRRGQVILKLDDARARARLAEREAEVGQQEARLDELRRGPRGERIDQARATFAAAERDLAFQSAELERIRDVAERGLAAPDSLDRAEAAYDTARANLDLRRSQLEETLTGTTIEELDQAEQLLAQAMARRDAAAIDVARHRITAPVDGLADTRLFEEGETPAAGQPVFTLLGGDQVHARVFVPVSLRASVLPGMTASVHVDGKAEPLPGRVRWVSSDPAFTPYYALTERDRGHLSFMAKIDLLDGAERLPDGVPVSVTFDGERRD